MSDPVDLLLPLLGSGILMGLRHAFDPDHVVAVSTILSGSSRLKTAFRYGASWGLGHTTTLLVTGLVVLLLQQSISDHVARAFEASVGVMMIVLGTTTFVPAATAPRLVNVRSFLVGTVHGLAGSAALMLLVLSTVHSMLYGIMYVLTFGVGSILGMALVCGLLSFPLSLASGHDRLFRSIRTGVGLVSIAVGLFIVVQMTILS